MVKENINVHAVDMRNAWMYCPGKSADKTKSFHNQSSADFLKKTQSAPTKSIKTKTNKNKNTRSDMSTSAQKELT